MRPQILNEAIDQLAHLQAGHVAGWQLLRLGLTRNEVRRLAGRLGWFGVHRGVWRLPGVGLSQAGTVWAAILCVATDEARRAGEPDRHQPWLAPYFAACRAAAATGITAAFFHGIVANPPSLPQLLLPHTVQRRLVGVRVVRTRVLPPSLQVVQGVPVVPPLRMLWDIAWIIRTEPDAVPRLCRWMSAADGLRLVAAATLHEVARQPQAFDLPAVVPEVFRAAAFILSRGHSHSGTEHVARQIVTEVAGRLGLTVEPRPHPIRDGDRVVAEADIAIPRIRLDIEVDGPHHDEPEQQRRDRWRDDQALALGWIVRRFKAQWVTDDPERFRRAVEAEIRRAAAAAGVVLTG